MRFYACIVCKTSYQVGGKPEELRTAWPLVESAGEPTCPTPLCQGKLARVKMHAKGFQAKEIPFPIFYRAINGFGTPDGEAASLKRFKKLLTTKKILEVHAHPVGQPERVILQRLVLEGGIRLHFDTSAKGACCYYIEEPGPTCLEVFDESESARESADSNREEGGRSPEAVAGSSEAAGVGGTTSSPTAERAEPGGVPPVSEGDQLPEPDRSPDGVVRPHSSVRV